MTASSVFSWPDVLCSSDNINHVCFADSHRQRDYIFSVEGLLVACSLLIQQTVVSAPIADTLLSSF